MAIQIVISGGVNLQPSNVTIVALGLRRSDGLSTSTLLGLTKKKIPSYAKPTTSNFRGFKMANFTQFLPRNTYDYSYA